MNKFISAFKADDNKHKYNEKDNELEEQRKMEESMKGTEGTFTLRNSRSNVTKTSRPSSINNSNAEIKQSDVKVQDNNSPIFQRRRRSQSSTQRPQSFIDTAESDTVSQLVFQNNLERKNKECFDIRFWRFGQKRK
eukprot:NODE_21_length_42443_cov_0.822808.p34 type:complete len:136 gc:universal NODE_21_length_42443_cov_0.822808:3361-2954(-)